MQYKDFYSELFDKPLQVKDKNTHEFSAAYKQSYVKTFDFSTKENEDYQMFLMSQRIFYYPKSCREIFKKYGYDTSQWGDFAVNIAFSKGGDDDNAFNIISTVSFIKVFSTVIQICRREIENDEAVIFSAKSSEPSRIALYRALIKRFKRQNDVIEETTENNQVFFLIIPKKQDKVASV